MADSLSGNFVDLTMWSIAECSVALISAHVPSLHFLFTRFVKKFKRQTTSNTKNSTVLDTDQAGSIQKHGLSRQDSSFHRLPDEQAGPGFTDDFDQYGVSACAMKYGGKDEEIELESPHARPSRIHVSQRIDVAYNAGNYNQGKA